MRRSRPRPAGRWASRPVRSAIWLRSSRSSTWCSRCRAVDGWTPAFPRALSTGAVLTGSGALVRLAAPDSYVWAFAGQCVIAAGQPLVLNAITKIAARYFPPAERTTAVSVGSVALFVGVLAAVLTGGPLREAGGLTLLVWAQAGLSVLAAAWVLVTARIPPAFAADVSVAPSLTWLRSDRLMWLLGGLLFIGMGEFNAVATWLESILGHFGLGGAAGYLIAIMVGAGVVGAAVLPDAFAARDRRRDLLLIAVAVSVPAFAAITLWHNAASWPACWPSRDSSCSPRCPVVLDWSELHAGEQAGRRRGRVPAARRATSAASSSCWSSRADRQPVLPRCSRCRGSPWSGSRWRSGCPPGPTRHRRQASGTG